MEIDWVPIVDTWEAYVSPTAIITLILMASRLYSRFREKYAPVRRISITVPGRFIYLPSSSAIIQNIEDICATGLAAMAYYYFDFRDSRKQDRYGLVASLLSQLSAASDSCCEILSQSYSCNAGGTRKPTCDTLTRHLKDMLSLPGQQQIYFIIDALDECPNISGTPSAREEVLELVEELVGLDLRNLHLCVASRPEIDIRTVLGVLTPLQISLHNESGQKADIIKYIKSVVYSDRRMRKWKTDDQQLLVDTLSVRAGGM